MNILMDYIPAACCVNSICMSLNSGQKWLLHAKVTFSNPICSMGLNLQACVCGHWQLWLLHNPPYKNLMPVSNQHTLTRPVLCSLLFLSTSHLSSASILWTFGHLVCPFSVAFSTVYKRHWNLCFGWMNICCGVVISGQEMEMGPECFVDPCHMTRETGGETKTLLQIWESKLVVIQRCTETKDGVAWRPKTETNTHRCNHWGFAVSAQL